MTGRFDSRIAIVTRAAHGLGRTVARRYASEGAGVHAVDRIGESLVAEVEALVSEGHVVHVAALDVADADAVTALVRRVHEAEGGVDVFVFAAGITVQTPIMKTSIEAFDRILNSILRRAFLLCRAIAQIMISLGRASEINVSARAGEVGSASEVAYRASMSRVEGLSRAPARDLEPFGIAVTSITPGTPAHTSVSEITCTSEKRRIWKAADGLTGALVSMASESPSSVHNRCSDTWCHSERLRGEGWL